MSKSGREPFEALFEQARGDAFTPAELDRLWQGVVAGGGAGGGPGPESLGGAGNGAGYAGSGATLKAAAIVVVAVSVGIAGLAVHRVRSPSADERAPVASATTMAVAAEVPSSDPTSLSGGPPTLTWDDLPKRPDAPARPQRPHAGAAPAAEVETTATIEAIASAPETLGAPVAPAAQTDPTPSEGALLLRARRSLVSDPSSALALTDEDARRFPAGPLAPEREVLAIEALVELRRLPEAKTRLAAFRARYPQSPHLARLDALVGP